MAMAHLWWRCRGPRRQCAVRDEGGAAAMEGSCEGMADVGHNQNRESWSDTVLIVLGVPTFVTMIGEQIVIALSSQKVRWFQMLPLLYPFRRLEKCVLLSLFFERDMDSP
jgi:hypothetical protein